MAKHGGPIWIDGFNFFHIWQRTAASFKNSPDIAGAQEEAIRSLALILGKIRGRTVLFMDGGPQRQAFTLEGLRIRYAGPGISADDLMEEAIRAKNGGGKIAVITGDNFLAATMRRNGCRIISPANFVRDYLQKSAKNAARTPAAPAKPAANLSESEVSDWLNYFGIDPADEE